MNNSTAVSNVIPFTFQAKSVRVQEIDGAPWFCVTDVCSILGYSNSRDAMSKHCREAGVAKRDISSAGQKRSLTFISEGNLYRLIIKSRKEEAQRFESWVCDEVLPAIRKSGTYTDSSNKMSTLVDDVIGVSGTSLINGVIGQKVAILPVGIQRQAKHKLHAILHTRFNVPRTELIPAGKLDVACEYLAAYVLEGEFLPKQVVGTLVTMTATQALQVHSLIHHAAWVAHYWRHNIGPALQRVGSDVHSGCNEHMESAERYRRSLDEDLLPSIREQVGPTLMANFGWGVRPQARAVAA